MAIIKSTSSLSAPQKKVNIGKFFASSQKKVQTAKVKQNSDALRNELISIRDNVIKIDNLVRSNLIFQRKVTSDNRKNKEGEERSKREKKLESYKSKLPGVEFPVLPRFDFIESIKRFIFFTFLGAAFPKLIELVPKLVNFAKIISPAVNFFADVAKGLLNGLVTFIDWGYQIQDNTQKIAKQIGGENAEKKFNEFNRSLNTFIDLSILAGLTALDVGLDAERFRREQLKKGQQKPPRVRVGVTEGRGGAKGLGKGPVTTGRGGDKKLGRGARVTGSGVDKGPLSKLKGPFAKLKGPLSKFAGAAVPGLGAVVGAADAKARFAAGDNVGGTLASISATLDTLVAGSAILAATGIGAAVPAAFATVSMGIDAVLLIRDIIKAFFPQIPMFVGGGRIRLMAQGGRVGSPGRSIKVSRKKLPIGKPQDTRPGKDVGGKQQILKLFPDGSPENIRQTTTASPWWARLFGGGNNQTASQPIGGKRPSPLKAIENTSKALKKIPIPFISALMGAGSDVNLGQKPDKNLGDIVGGSIGKLTQDIIDNNMKLSFSDIVRFISGYANGGDVRSGNIIKENDIGYQVGSMVSKVISTAISSRVDEAINGILREITGQGKPAEEQAPGGVDGGLPLYGGPGIEGLSDFISRAETGGRWNAYNNDSGKGDDRILTLKLTELRSYISRNYPNSSGAVGAYQFMPETAIGYARQLGLDPSKTVFSPEIQRKLNLQHLRDLGYDDYVSGKITRAQYGRRIAQQYRAVPDPTTGYTYSDSAASRNRATVTLQSYNDALDKAKQQAQPLLLSPGRIPKADYIKGVLDESGESGFDVTWKGDNNIAVLPGRVKEIGQLYGSGYGNVVVIESIDPVNGKKVDVMYAHFPTGGISVREGQQVSTGQVLGRMGKAGEPGIGNISGQHASIDFYEPNTRRGQITGRYSRWQGLSREIISAAQTGNNPSNWPRSQSQPPRSPTLPPPPRRDNRPPSAVPSTLSRGSGRPSLDLRELGLKKNPVTGVWEKASLAPSQSLNLGSGLNIQPSYEEGSSSLVAIQLVNRTTIVSETA